MAHDPIQHKKYMREVWYPKNRDKHVALAKVSRQKRVDLVMDIKRKAFCADCGVSGQDHPEIMDFDHLGDKKYSVSHAARTRSAKVLQEEMAKCEIVCSNCHRIRTYERIYGKRKENPQQGRLARAEASNGKEQDPSLLCAPA